MHKINYLKIATPTHQIVKGHDEYVLLYSACALVNLSLYLIVPSLLAQLMNFPALFFDSCTNYDLSKKGSIHIERNPFDLLLNLLMIIFSSLLYSNNKRGPCMVKHIKLQMQNYQPHFKNKTGCVLTLEIGRTKRIKCIERMANCIFVRGSLINCQHDFYLLFLSLGI